MMIAVGGALAGALMGLAFIAHMSVLLTIRPPAALSRRVDDSNIAAIVAFGTVFSVTSWILAGVAAAIVSSAATEAYPSDIPSVPSMLYLSAVVFLAALTAIPAALLFRDRLVHLFLQYALFIGIFGWLVPFIVAASQE
ncbi:MAG: hypothetical protein WD208_10520 [Dehalococcoidia bacterium]